MMRSNTSRPQNMATFQHAREVNITNATFVLTAGAAEGTTSRVLGQDHDSDTISSLPSASEAADTSQPVSASRVPVTDSTSNIHSTIMRANAESHLVVRADHDIYYNQLLVKGRGSPMWIPGPDLNLPKEYRREGVMIGDVGILYNLEGFSFLFNIFLPANHPINIGRVPDGFEPLDYSRLQHETKKQTLFGPSDYLASSSMQKLSSVDSSDLIFETSATEGAVLTMPDGATTEDLMSRKSIRQYISKNAESWYWFVREVREREVENGDIRLVVGYDRVSSWGIATFASSTGHQVRLEFRGRDDVSETYRWNCVGSGSGRVGPYDEDIKDLRRETDTSDVKNQCVFLRTLNFTLSGEIWDNLMVHQVRSSLHFPRSMGQSKLGDGTMSNRQAGSSGGDSGGRESSSSHGVTFHATQFGLTVVHPANPINKCLLEQCPNARIAITGDEDWMSAITQQDVVFPGSDEICFRLLANREISEEDGIVCFNSQENALHKQVSSMDSSSGPPLVGRKAPPTSVALLSDVEGRKRKTKLYFEQTIDGRMSPDHERSDVEHFADEEFDGTQDDQDDEDTDEMDVDNELYPVSPQEKESYKVNYESLNQQAVEKRIAREVDYICGICSVGADVASLLLRHMKWNREKLIENYMDSASKVLVDAGATLPEAPPPPTRTTTSANIRTSTRRRNHMLGFSKVTSPTTPPPASSVARSLKRTPSKTADELFMCQICLNDEPGLQTLALDCDHAFCKECWNAYVLSKVEDESEHAIQCIANGCTLILPDLFILDSLSPATGSPLEDPRSETNSKAWKRFKELIVRQYVACNKNMKFCPYPSCTNVVFCPSTSSRATLSTVVPIVSCGARGICPDQDISRNPQFGPGLQGKEHKFCFGCPIESDHRPLICAVAKMWLKKCRDDGETANWIMASTQTCLRCQSGVERHGGCNHMTCKKCRHEFCWVCKNPWSQHSTAWYSCNRYDGKAGKSRLLELALPNKKVNLPDANASLPSATDVLLSQLPFRSTPSSQETVPRSESSERYLHYYDRWANHEQSAKLSLDLYAKTEKRVEEMVKSAHMWPEVQFMKTAVEEIEKSRMTLKWTYAMAYYLAKGNGKELFEDNQRDLERAVEDLSELLESYIDPWTIPTLRQPVMNQTVYVQKRNEIMLEYTADGLLEERWKWNVSVEGFDDRED